MNILILSSNNGHGHNSAALSLKDYFEHNGIDCDICDCLSFVSKSVSKIVSSVHNLSYSKLNKLYNVSYSCIERNRKTFHKDSFSRKFLDCGVNKLAQYIVDNKIDCVISVHIFGAILACDVSYKWNLNFIKAFVSTDYSCTPGVEELNNTIIFIPDKNIYSLYSPFVDNSCQLISSGIPISKKFKYRRKEDSNGLHTLISVNVNKININKKLLYKIVKLCNKDNQVRLICGNDELFKFYSKFKSKNFQVFRWTNNAANDLNWADICIIKAGGLSVAESIAMKTPMLIYKLINAYEHDNCEYVIENNFGMVFENPYDLYKKWTEIANNKCLIDEYKEALDDVDGNNACEIIYNRIVD